MDKLKSVMDFMKKFGFWLLLGLIVVMVLGCWWVGTASVAAVIKKQKDDITKNFTDVSSIVTSPPPNHRYIEALNKENQTLQDKVYAAWKTLYDEQKKNNPWPPVLGKEFLEMINDENRKPDSEIRPKYRETYLNFIQQYFPELFKIVDLRRPADESEADEGTAKKPSQVLADPNKSTEMIGIVDWDQGDIARLKGQFSWQTTPSDLKVKLAQEDIWVYLSLLRVIKNTNGEVTEHSKAAIKRIDALEIGARAVAAWRAAEGKVFTGAVAASGTSSAQTVPETKATPASGESAQANEDALLKQDRYVDDKGEPLAADAKSPYNEFKMMPIRMRIYIDQRKIAKLLAECANSAMPIEVRRVRIKPDEGDVVDLASMSTERAAGGSGTPAMTPNMPGGHVMPGMPGMPGMPAMPGMPGGGRGAMGYGAMPRPAQGGGYPIGGARGGDLGGSSWEKSPMDIPVEILGLICIYNPPDKDKIGKGAAGETVAAPAAAPATPASAGKTATPTPAATPTAATPAAPLTAPSAAPVANPAAPLTPVK